MKALSTLPSSEEFELMQRMAKPFLQSGFLPDTIKNLPQALVIMQKGRELSIPPLQAFSHISVIKGKPTMSAELMLALIYRELPESVIDFVELSNEKCVIEARRPKGKMNRFEFSMEDAKRAGLSDQFSWKKYPRALLRSRCISEMARSLFPDAIAGASYTPEELGAEVNEDGLVKEIFVSEVENADTFTDFTFDASTSSGESSQDGTP